jgi:hypothetical protein
MTKAHYFFLLLYCWTSSFSFAQTPPLPLMTQYLSLTSSQVRTIVENNNAFNQFSSDKQTRISQVQAEIAQVTQASPIDPMGLGVRYAEIEEICRELRMNATQSQQQNRAILTDAQKVKLQALQDAINLMPVISEDQLDNLLASNTAQTASFTTSFAGFLLGTPVSGTGPGCIAPGNTLPVVTVPIPAPTAKPKN